MKLTSTYTRILLTVLVLVASSCSIEKYIPEDKILYTGAEIETTLEEDADNVKIDALNAELNTLLQPEPNAKVLGMRLGLYYHYKAQREKPGFINKWLNKKVGEEPVYFSQVDPLRVEELILNRMDNRGFFYGRADSSVDSTGQYASVDYKVTVPEPYTIENYEIEKDSLPIYDELRDLMAGTEIDQGDRFDLQLLKYERERIDQALKKRGYYNFNSDFIIFEADTNQYDTKKFDLFLRLKENTPSRSVIPYVIDSLTVHPNYTIDGDTLTTVTDTVNGINFVQKEEFFKPEKLEPYILFEKGQKYDSETARLTSNRLSSLNSYKFVNIRFEEKDTIPNENGNATLNADIFLSPLNKRQLRAELQAVSKSNGFAGPGIGLTYSNRNFFRGGETLSISGNFAYETQISSGSNSGLSSIAGGLKADLIIPRLVPFSPSRFKYSVPKTKISLGGDILKRSKLYTLTSVNSSFGYTWNANEYVYHELNPISVSYVNLADTTAEFDSILEKNPFLRQSFEQQFIAGMNYSFTYSELGDEEKSRPFFLQTNLDVAGNALSLFSGGSGTVFGLEYAQYAKLDVDMRYYLKWGKDNGNAFITRLYGGWGIPYGNSNTLPFVKQFFSGGPYSVRAFQIRSLGPGTYTSNSDGNASFFDQSGNLKLEANMEYRFPLFSYLKGAIFADAGNVWLTNELELSDDEPQATRDFNQELSSNGQFGSNWTKELGIGVGVGLRVDIQSFVIRLDLASPIQTPYLPEGERTRAPFFGGGNNNLVWNFAIGYPF